MNYKYFLLYFQRLLLTSIAVKLRPFSHLQYTQQHGAPSQPICSYITNIQNEVHQHQHQPPAQL